jgi:alkanesulfonate monooxygenase SsuD/methylene tetrahydromethanopterin reductase-like flavin-dependent oxidoreductase (luciferase family)
MNHRDGLTVGLRRGIVFATDALEPLLNLSQRAEACGFDRVWTTEYPGRDSIARALAIAMRTTTIEIGTGVAYAFARPPMAMSALAYDVQRLSRGRFALGLSPGTRGVRRWYGAEFEHPAPRMVTYANELRRSWQAAPMFDVAPPPLYSAAFNAIMTRYVASVYDGLVLHPLAAGATHLRERLLPAMRAGAAERDKPPSLAAWRVISLDADEKKARERARAQLAFYFSTPSYAIAVEGTRWAGVPSLVREAFRASAGNPGWTTIGNLIPEDMVDEFALAGTPDSVRERIAPLERELADLGVSELVFQAVGSGISTDEAMENCNLIISELGRDRKKQIMTTSTEG